MMDKIILVISRIRFQFLYFGLLLILFSCQEEGNIEKEPNQHLVSYEKLKTYSFVDIQNTYKLLKLTYNFETDIENEITNGVEVFKVVYNTEHKGEEILASGLVCIPDKKDEAYPVLSFQNGTNTLHSRAPSLAIDDIMLQPLHTVAGLGFIVCIPDYIGFGVSSGYMHPYLVKEPTVTAIIDMFKALPEFLAEDEIDLDTNAEMFLLGYSQGGWSTLALFKELEMNPLLNYTIKAVSCGAGSYDLDYVRKVVLSQDIYTQPFYMAYIFEAYRDMNIISEPLNTFYKEPYATAVDGIFDGELDGGEINQMLTNYNNDLYTDIVLNSFDTAPELESLRNALLDNSVAAWNISSPLRLYHGTSDASVPPGVSDKIYQDFINVGVQDNRIQLIKFNNLNHGSALMPYAFNTLDWFVSLK